MSVRKNSLTHRVGCALAGGLLALAPALGFSATANELYSQKAVMQLCADAQREMTGTAVAPLIVINHRPLEGSTPAQTFVYASAAPYSDINRASFNGRGFTGNVEPGYNLPLTVQQYTSYDTTGQWGWIYPSVVSCKMKDAESIQYYFGASAAGTQQQCRVMNEKIVADVFSALTSWQQRTLVYQESDFTFQDDLDVGSGPAFVNPLNAPTGPNIIFYGTTSSELVVKSRYTKVARTYTGTEVTEDKKGVYYCHLPTPEHVMRIATGQVLPCFYDSDFCLRL